MSDSQFWDLHEIKSWHYFLTAISFLDSIVQMIKDERLNTKLSLTSFEDTIHHIEEFYKICVKEVVQKDGFDTDSSRKIVCRDLMMNLGLDSLAIYFRSRQREIMITGQKEHTLLEKSADLFRKCIETV